MLRLPPLLLALAGCTYVVEIPPIPTHISPLDGQTAIDPDLPLTLYTGGLDLPPDHPVPPETIRVVDLENGAPVSGNLDRQGDRLRFTPKRAWEAGHSYVWTVSDGPAEARQPAVWLPDAVLGDAVFRAGDGDAVLDAALLEGSPDLCVVLSRAVRDGLPDLALTVQDQPVDGTWTLQEEQGVVAKHRSLHRDDAPVSLACLPLPEHLAVDGIRIRAWWGTEGPWSFIARPRPLDEMTAPLRRAAQ